MKDQDSRELLKTFRELKGKEKTQYFFDYILIWVAVIVFAILAIFWIGMRVVNWKASYVDLLVINADTELEKPLADDFFDAFLEKKGENPKRCEIDYKITTGITRTKEDLNNQSNQAMQAIEMQLYGNLIDVIFANEDICETIAQEGFLQDVRDYLPDDLLKQYEDQLVWIDFQEDGQKHAIGIRLDQDNQFMKNSKLYKKDAIVGVVVGCPQDANAKKFVISILREDL